MTNLFEAIKKIAKENPDGFTVKIPALEWVVSGYIAAYLETQRCINKERTNIYERNRTSSFSFE